MSYYIIVRAFAFSKYIYVTIHYNNCFGKLLMVVNF